MKDLPYLKIHYKNTNNDITYYNSNFYGFYLSNLIYNMPEEDILKEYKDKQNPLDVKQISYFNRKITKKTITLEVIYSKKYATNNKGIYHLGDFLKNTVIENCILVFKDKEVLIKNSLLVKIEEVPNDYKMDGGIITITLEYTNILGMEDTEIEGYFFSNNNDTMPIVVGNNTKDYRVILQADNPCGFVLYNYLEKYNYNKEMDFNYGKNMLFYTHLKSIYFEIDTKEGIYKYMDENGEIKDIILDIDTMQPKDYLRFKSIMQNSFSCNTSIVKIGVFYPADAEYTVNWNASLYLYKNKVF